MKDLEIKTMEQLINVCGKNIPNTRIIECNYLGMSYCMGNCHYSKVMERYAQITRDRIIRQSERTMVEMAGQSLDCSG